MRAVLILLLLSATINVHAGRASKYFDYFNTEAFWGRFQFESGENAPAISESDTCILIASNRAPGADSLRFLSEDLGDGTIRYFLVHSKNGKWNIRPCTNLKAGIALLQQRQPRPWVIYTEGMGKIFTSDVDRGMRMAGEYGVNVVLLDYPSIHTGYGSFKNYRFAWNNSTAIYEDFAPVFDTLRSLRGTALTGPFTLFFHSMGNNLMRKLVQKDLLRTSTESQWVDNLVLNAPCVPRWGSKRWIDSLGFAERIIVNYNPEDRVLKLASIAGFRGVLGLGPKRTISRNARYVNFNAVTGYGHSNFLGLYGRPMPPEAAFAHYRILLAGKNPPLSDTARYRPIERADNMYMLR